MHRTALFIFVAASLAAVPLCVGAEPALEFIRELDNAGYHEMALEYLDRIDRDSQLPREIKLAIPYERALALLKMSRAEANPLRRRELFAAAMAQFSEVIDEKNPRATDARLHLGQHILELAEAKLAALESSKSPSPERSRARTEALATLHQAQHYFATAKENAEADLARARRKPAELVVRGQAWHAEVQSRQLEAQFSLSHIRYLQALAEQKDSADRHLLLITAADGFADVYEKQETTAIKLDARLREGQCYQALETSAGRKQALGRYFELLRIVQQGERLDPTDRLRVRALNQAMNCWTLEGEPGDAIAFANGFADVLRLPAESATKPEWVDVQLQLVKAYQAEANSLSATDPKRHADIYAALVILRQISAVEGPVRNQVKQAIAEFGRLSRSNTVINASGEVTATQQQGFGLWKRYPARN